MSRRVRSGRTLGNRARLRVRGCKVSTYRGCRFRAVAAPLNASFFGHPPWIPRFRADSRRGASVRSGARIRHGPSIGGGADGVGHPVGRDRARARVPGVGAGCRAESGLGEGCGVEMLGHGVRVRGAHRAGFRPDSDTVPAQPSGDSVRVRSPAEASPRPDSARPSPVRPPPPCRARPGTDRPPILPSDPRTRPTVRLATSVQVRS